ncbi:hypothetical protein ACFPMF_01690 [Larkinella bovis]|uniref:Gp5/Type VI secretion system Vgr protein OB-fold domain-containing protein n=1 Tax=Larkinella bovis TaxID=683041 RepID=A0ABW0I641_9BACT
MGKNAEILQALRGLNGTPIVQVWPAVVKAVGGTTCTVDIIGTDLVDLEGVKLRADDEASEGILLTPRVGSFVYVGCIENEISNLFVCQFSEVDAIAVVIEGVTLQIDQAGATLKTDDIEVTLTDKAVLKKGDVELTLDDGATIKQDQTELSLKSGKVTVKNAGVNLKDLFTGLTTLLKSFQVVCGPAGSPSAAVFPATLTSITQVETKVNQLLQ